MRICVLGLWHLGLVTAACMAKIGHRVTGLDVDAENISRLKRCSLHLYEPGLEDLVKTAQERGQLDFTADPATLANAEVLWVAFDTPVDEEDRADVEFVAKSILAVAGFLPRHLRIVISSQVPVGFTRRMERQCRELYPDRDWVWAYSPENLRLGKAIQVFENPDRIVIGISRPRDSALFQPLFSSICDRLEWMNIESAEMTKHAVNAFLATSVVFANEIAALCERVGADAKEVERGLKSEARIGPKAYVSPGTAFAGGTLARDIHFLTEMGQSCGEPALLFHAVRDSNDHHRDWAKRKCGECFPDLGGRRVAVLGLTYKPGTNTLRRSLAIELCRWLHAGGAQVTAFDPQIKTLPDDLQHVISLQYSVAETLDGADCVVIATEHPEFRDIDGQLMASLKTGAVVIDANGVLEKICKEIKNLRYIAVGRKS